MNANLFDRSAIAAARKAMQLYCRSLTSEINSNPKLTKMGQSGVLSVPLHLAPFNTSGYQVCPAASNGCAAACLATAGNPMFLKRKTEARINRTKFFFANRRAYMIVLWAELRKHQNYAIQQNRIPGCRLNATSDISWEKIKLPDTELSIINAFPSMLFYDYTKREKRMISFLRGEMPDNYYLTFSASEDNWGACLRVLNVGGTVTVVFDIGRYRPMITEYEGWPVIDGDEHDFRPDDPPGHIIGLRAKGDALKDTSGFVHRVEYKG